MGGKGGQVLGQVLSVPDVAQEIAVHADLRLPAGHVQPALSHHAVQCHGLDGNGLSACVGPSNDDPPELLPDLKLQRHTLFGLHQRMPPVPEYHVPIRIDPGLCSAVFQAQTAF